MNVYNYLNNAYNVVKNPYIILEKQPKRIKEILNKYGNNNIINIYVCRQPILNIFKKLLNYLSFNTLKYNINKLNYDELYHLFITIELDNNIKILLERNQRIEIKIYNKQLNIYGDCIKIEQKGNITLNELFYNGVNNNSSSINFYIYDAIKNNCQRFVYDILNANKDKLIINNNINNFIKQRLDNLLITNPKLFKFIKSITNTANIFDNIYYGGN